MTNSVHHGAVFSFLDAKQLAASLLCLLESYHWGILRKREGAGGRQGEDSTSEEIPCLQEGADKEPFSAATASPKPLHVPGAVAANAGRKGAALSSLALMVSIK